MVLKIDNGHNIMPYSSKEGKHEISEWFKNQSDILTIVDIGCGSGTYPKLLDNKYIWIGIEIYEPYVEEFKLNEIYNRLLIGNFFDLINSVNGDCIIFGDVLEHMTKEDVIRAIEIANKKFKHIVISIPIGYEQGPTENPYEEHKSIWTMEEINSLIPESFTMRGISWDIAIFIK